MQRQIATARLQQTHDFGMPIKDPVDEIAECAARFVGALQALANSILTGLFFALGPHRYVAGSPHGLLQKSARRHFVNQRVRLHGINVKEICDL
jgi:hypothetical protein